MQISEAIEVLMKSDPGCIEPVDLDPRGHVILGLYKPKGKKIPDALILTGETFVIAHSYSKDGTWGGGEYCSGQIEEIADIWKEHKADLDRQYYRPADEQCQDEDEIEDDRNSEEDFRLHQQKVKEIINKAIDDITVEKDLPFAAKIRSDEIYEHSPVLHDENSVISLIALFFEQGEETGEEYEYVIEDKNKCWKAHIFEIDHKLF